MKAAEYKESLDAVPGLDDILDRYFHEASNGEERYFLKEFLLHGLAEYSLLSKHLVESGTRFSDLLSSMLSGQSVDEDDY